MEVVVKKLLLYLYGSYLGKFIWFVLGSFLENPMNIFHISILNTISLKKCLLIQVIAGYHYVNFLIFLTILGVCYLKIFNSGLNSTIPMVERYYV